MERIASANDPRVARFVNTTDPHRVESTTHFLVESENVVTRFLASDFACETVLCAEHKVDRIAPLLKPETELLVADRALVNEIVGFKFHSGVMAIGRRKPPLTIDSLLAADEAPPHPGPLPRGRGDQTTLLILPEITDAANIGALIRTAAAFGCDGIVLGEQCRDPFIRQTIRVSMGTIFFIPLVQSTDIRADLRVLREKHGVELWATVLDDEAVSLERAERGKRIGLLLGNEGPGLEANIVKLCDRKVTIPMRRGTDSLNVGASCAVFLYHFTRDAS